MSLFITVSFGLFLSLFNNFIYENKKYANKT